MNRSSTSRPRFIVHVGRHKSGTTALQGFLNSNDELLASENLMYPRSGRKDLGHHQLTRSIRGDASLMSDLNAEISQHSGSVVVSSEILQSVSPKKLAKVLPVGDTDIVIYLREQVDYLVSHYAQRIKFTDSTSSFSHFMNEQLDSAEQPYEYLRQVRAWSRHFGQERVKVRIYDRVEMPGGSTVADFCELYNIPAGASQRTDEKNTSLTGDVLAAKRLLNATVLAGTGYTHPDIVTRLREVGSLLPARGSEIDPDVARQLRERFADNNRTLFAEFVADGRSGFREPEMAAPPQTSDLDSVIDIVQQILVGQHP